MANRGGRNRPTTPAYSHPSFLNEGNFMQCPYNDNGMPMGTDVLIGILIFACCEEGGGNG